MGGGRKVHLTTFTLPAVGIPCLPLFSFPRCTSDLAFLHLPRFHQFPGLLAAARHLPHFRLVCPEGRDDWVGSR